MKELRHYRKFLQKINATKVKILSVLYDDGCPRSGGDVGRGLPSRLCSTMQDLPWVPDHWKLRVHAGSVQNAESTRDALNIPDSAGNGANPPPPFKPDRWLQEYPSVFDAMGTDLGNYKQRIEDLSEASLDLDATLDKWPRRVMDVLNPLCLKPPRDRDLTNENRQYTRIEDLVARYRSYKERMTEVNTSGDDIVTEQEEAREFGITSATQTFRALDNPDFILGRGQWVEGGAEALQEKLLQMTFRGDSFGREEQMNTEDGKTEEPGLEDETLSRERQEDIRDKVAFNIPLSMNPHALQAGSIVSDAERLKALGAIPRVAQTKSGAQVESLLDRQPVVHVPGNGLSTGNDQRESSGTARHREQG